MIKVFLKYFAGVGILAYLLLVLYVIYSMISNPVYLYQTDLVASFLTGARVIRGGEAKNLYDLETQYKFQNIVTSPFVRDLLLPFRNIPLVAVIYIPLTYLNLKTSTIVISFFSLLMLVTFHKYFSSHLKGNTSKLLLVAIFFWPNIAALITGQNSVMFLLAFAGIYILSSKEEYSLAGVVSSQLLLRPQLLIFLPFLWPLIKEKMKFLKGFSLTAIAIIIINVGVVGFLAILKYPAFVLQTEVPEYGNRLDQIISVYFLLKQIFPQIPYYTLTLINAFLYMLIAALYFKSWHKRTFERNIMIGILATVIFSVHSLPQDLIILLIPIYLLCAGLAKSCAYDRILFPLLYFCPVVVLFAAAPLITIILFSVMGIMFFFCIK